MAKKKDAELQAKKAQETKDAENKLLEEILVERFGSKYAEWKKQFAPRKLSVIVVEDKIAILRPIGSAEVSMYSMMVVNPEMGIDKASEYLLSELWIDGDTEIMNDEEFFISAMMQLQNVMELKKSSFYKV